MKIKNKNKSRKNLKVDLTIYIYKILGFMTIAFFRDRSQSAMLWVNGLE